MSEWLVILIFFYGIALGVWFGWGIWREPQLEYKDKEHE
jgi:predicted negative regulator of RcsB-dependent stress response